MHSCSPACPTKTNQNWSVDMAIAILLEADEFMVCKAPLPLGPGWVPFAKNVCPRPGEIRPCFRGSNDSQELAHVA